MIRVNVIDFMGSDLSVVNAARVSFDKESELEVACEHCNGDYEAKCWIYDNVCSGHQDKLRLSNRDTKLIKYLADHQHWSPFAHCFASFRVSAPIFVARQLQKHTVGLAWNEVSRRYVDSEPTFYTPDRWRKRAENVKQGSSNEPVNGQLNKTLRYTEVTEAAVECYEAMIADGVCPEQARMVLPQSMMTEWIWSGSLYAFARVCNLRLDSHSQRETQEIAKQISAPMLERFPVSWTVLVPACHG